MASEFFFFLQKFTTIGIIISRVARKIYVVANTFCIPADVSIVFFFSFDKFKTRCDLFISPPYIMRLKTSLSPFSYTEKTYDTIHCDVDVFRLPKFVIYDYIG